MKENIQRDVYKHLISLVNKEETWFVQDKNDAAIKKQDDVAWWPLLNHHHLLGPSSLSRLVKPLFLKRKNERLTIGLCINIEGEIKKHIYNTQTQHQQSNTHTIGSSSLRFQYCILVDAELGPATYSVDVAQFFNDLHQISLIQSRHFFPKICWNPLQQRCEKINVVVFFIQRRED